MGRTAEDVVIEDVDIQRAKDNGISYMTLYNRIVNYEWELERAITTPPLPKFGNERRFTEEDLKRAEENGVKYNTLVSRIHMGWDKERALTQPPRKLKR